MLEPGIIRVIALDGTKWERGEPWPSQAGLQLPFLVRAIDLREEPIELPPGVILPEGQEPVAYFFEAIGGKPETTREHGLFKEQRWDGWEGKAPIARVPAIKVFSWEEIKTPLQLREELKIQKEIEQRVLDEYGQQMLEIQSFCATDGRIFTVGKKWPHRRSVPGPGQAPKNEQGEVIECVVLSMWDDSAPGMPDTLTICGQGWKGSRYEKMKVCVLGHVSEAAEMQRTWRVAAEKAASDIAEIRAENAEAAAPPTESGESDEPGEEETTELAAS